MRNRQAKQNKSKTTHLNRKISNMERMRKYMDSIKKFLSVFLINIFLIFVWPSAVAVYLVSELLNKSEKRVYLQFSEKM
jgi:uncharacterized membrane protein